MREAIARHRRKYDFFEMWMINLLQNAGSVSDFQSRKVMLMLIAEYIQWNCSW